MNGKTHLIIGVTLGIGACVTFEMDITHGLMAIGTAVLGAIIPDIDVNKDSCNKIIGEGTILITMALIISGLLYCMTTGLHSEVLCSPLINKRLYGYLLFLIVCLFGNLHTHRGFMHSIMAMVLLTFSVSVFATHNYMWFAMGYMSHLLFDIMNKKGIQLFYPLRKRIGLKLFSSNGTGNQYLQRCCTVFIFICFIKYLVICLKL